MVLTIKGNYTPGQYAYGQDITADIQQILDALNGNLTGDNFQKNSIGSDTILSLNGAKIQNGSLDLGVKGTNGSATQNLFTDNSIDAKILKDGTTGQAKLQLATGTYLFTKATTLSQVLTAGSAPAGSIDFTTMGVPLTAKMVNLLVYIATGFNPPTASGVYSSTLTIAGLVCGRAYVNGSGGAFDTNSDTQYLEVILDLGPSVPNNVAYSFSLGGNQGALDVKLKGYWS